MQTLTHRPAWLAQTLALALWLSATLAQAEPNAEQRQEMEAAQKAAQAAEVRGPADIPLGEQAVLKLPAGMGYIPQPAAGRFMRAMGNSSDERMLGLIESLGEDPWLVVARWEPSGFIKDDDARDWDINALHQSLKEGTEASNSERRERGFPELEVLDWVERPHYDAASHRLVWSLAAQTKGSPQGEAYTVNYNTYALGREGYISLNLITGSDRIGQDKHAATTLLAALQYQPGKSYAEFNASTDHVAEYGLAALVAGVAAKKLGMFALAAAFLAKFAKVGALAALGLGAGLRKYFKKKNSDTAGTS
jgi:uncharacterized membrane-anchored protein